VSDTGSVVADVPNGGTGDKPSNQKEVKKIRTERVAWLDLLRVTSSFLVITSHVSARVAGGSPIDGVNFTELGWAGLIAAFFHYAAHSVAVPLFVMISGSLLLGRNESITTFYRKRFGKILLPFFVWMYISILCLWLAGRGLKDGTPITLASSLVAMLSGANSISGHFWAMYMFVSLYLVAPFLSIFVRNASKGVLMWFLALWFFANVIFPIINNTLKETLGAAGIPLAFPMVSLWLGFFVAGHVLKDIQVPRRWAPVLGIIWLGFAIAGPITVYLKNVYSDSSMSVFLEIVEKHIFPLESSRIIPATMVFLMFRSLGGIPSALSPRLGRIITAAAPMTFGVYLCHHILLLPVMAKLNLGSCNSWATVLCVIPALSVALYCSVAGFVYLLRRNRYLNFLAP